MKSEIPKKPVMFDKPLSSFLKSGEVLYLPRNNEVHHEIELGILFGKTGKDISESNW
jgi:acylpyruvate hydrolase